PCPSALAAITRIHPPRKRHVFSAVMTAEVRVGRGPPRAGCPFVSLLSPPRRFDARQRAQKAPRAYSATPIAPQKAAKNAKTPHQTTGLGSGFGSPKPSSTSADRSHSVR